MTTLCLFSEGSSPGAKEPTWCPDKAFVSTHGRFLQLSTLFYHICLGGTVRLKRMAFMWLISVTDQFEWTTLYRTPRPVRSAPSHEPNTGCFLMSLLTKDGSNRQQHASLVRTFGQSKGLPVLKVPDATPKVAANYYSWDGESKRETIIGSWRKRLPRYFCRRTSSSRRSN
jgi:hypothetical protein